MGEVIPIRAIGCIDCSPDPDTHDVRVDLYNCARGFCKECSRKSKKGCKKTEVGGCRHDLLDEACELLALLELFEKQTNKKEGEL